MTMKTLYLDCGMGAAGDMLTAALLELLPDPDSFIERLNALGIPGVRYAREPSVKCGITGTHISVTVNGEEEDEYLSAHHHHDHEHHHDHDHEHHHDNDNEHHHAHDHSHHHSSLHDIEHILHHISLPENVAADVVAVYRLIAEAESHAHGVPVSEIHFHEVGTMDAVADVTAVCLLMHELNPDRVVVSPVHVGFGKVRCAHGILPVPAPATAHILQGVPIYSGRIEGELCTPTGAALLKHFANEFGKMPEMSVEKIGYGMGKKDFEAANCVRAMLGSTDDMGGDSVVELECNLDDMTPEEIGFAMEMLFEAGALEVFTTPCGMKKSRPGTLLTVLLKPSDREKMVAQIFKHTTTIGIRESIKHRYTLDRRIHTADTDDGELRLKISEGYGIMRIKPEYDDLAAIARERGISLREARELIE